MHLASVGFRVIAHERRGFGKSDQLWRGYDYDTFSIKKFKVPVLITHGEDDAFVPKKATAQQIVQLIHNATLKIYESAPHEPLFTHREKLNNDLINFVRQ